mmetsp:Transcript_2006/g.4034  ORF Transcript_2006/g.4034 Transcript_2006/m.4034 type:complete len:352 (-) Transcript_2006:30-1085(-)
MPCFHKRALRDAQKTKEGRPPLLSWSDNNSDSEDSDDLDCSFSLLSTDEDLFFEQIHFKPISHLPIPVELLSSESDASTTTINTAPSSSPSTFSKSKKSLSKARQSSVDLTSLHSSSPPSPLRTSPLNELPTNSTSSQLADEWGFFVDMPDEAVKTPPLSSYDLSELNHVAVSLLPPCLTNLLSMGIGWGRRRIEKPTPPLQPPAQPCAPSAPQQHPQANIIKPSPQTTKRRPIIIANYKLSSKGSVATSGTASMASSISSSVGTPKPISIPTIPSLSSLNMDSPNNSSSSLGFDFAVATLAGEKSLLINSSSFRSSGISSSSREEPPAALPEAQSSPSSTRKGRFLVSPL